MLRNILKLDKDLPLWPIAITITLHLLTPFFSTGFYHFDEHFQILEFLSYFNGELEADLLPWEFSNKMRSWVQPLFYYIIQKPQILLGINNPFIHVLSFRLVTSLLSLFAMWTLWLWQKSEHSTSSNSKEKLKTYLYITCLLWFLPFLHARHSSETLSGALFIIGLSLTFLNTDLRPKKLLTFIAGLLFSLSFFTRFQLGIPIFFLVLWLVLIKKEKKGKTTLLLAGLVIGTCLCIAIDSLGYASLTLTPWNYLKQNLLLDKVSNFGKSPWYDYLKHASLRPFLPIGLMIVGSVLTFWRKKPLHILSWITVSFFAIHQLISHKELRFLFPMITLLPIFLTYFYHDYQGFFKKWNKVTKIIIVSNLILLFVYTFKPIHPSYNFYQYLYEYKNGPSLLYISNGMNPFRLADLPTNYFKRKNLAVANTITKSPYWAFVEKAHQLSPYMHNNKCRLHYSTYPLFLIKNEKILPKLKKHKVWALFQCIE
jgi:phosphatidylinositol glycan class B